jgi:NAD(P)-dependent dehydrogenase (short-subunit alcohol dehydrogenase family)
MPASSWQRAIVVGASSGIGAALARRLAAGGCRTVVLARREAELRALAAASPLITAEVHDVRQVAEVPALYARLTAELGGLDLLVYAAGVMPPIDVDDWPTAGDAEVQAVNVVGAMAWINEAAPRFAAAGRGTIVGISSVAGDRGRRGHPAYHASKAGLDAYLEAVRNRVARHGVRVVTIKPGPVDTPMSRALARRQPLLIDVDDAAGRIMRAMRRGGTAYVPWMWRPIMLALRSLPGWIFQRLNI